VAPRLPTGAPHGKAGGPPRARRAPERHVVAEARHREPLGGGWHDADEDSGELTLLRHIRPEIRATVSRVAGIGMRGGVKFSLRPPAVDQPSRWMGGPTMSRNDSSANLPPRAPTGGHGT
jgi:hypothetical protein